MLQCNQYVQYCTTNLLRGVHVTCRCLSDVTLHQAEAWCHWSPENTKTSHQHCIWAVQIVVMIMTVTSCEKFAKRKGLGHGGTRNTHLLGCDGSKCWERGQPSSAAPCLAWRIFARVLPVGDCRWCHWPAAASWPPPPAQPARKCPAAAATAAVHSLRWSRRQPRGACHPPPSAHMNLALCAPTRGTGCDVVLHL